MLIEVKFHNSMQFTFHFSAHFLVNSANTTFSEGCFFLCSSLHVCTKKAYEDIRPRGFPSALAFPIMFQVLQNLKIKITNYHECYIGKEGIIIFNNYYVYFFSKHTRTPGLDINVCPIPVKTDLGQIDLASCRVHTPFL